MSAPEIVAELVRRAHLQHPGSPMRRVVVRMEPREIARIDALCARFPKTKGAHSKCASRAAVLRAFVLYTSLVVEGGPT